MSSQGSAYARFRRSLQHGNPLLVRAAALELPRLTVDDALAVLLVIRAGEPERYEHAAVRWLGKLITDTRALELADAELALAALRGLVGQRPAPAAVALAELLAAVGYEEAARRLEPLSGG